MERGARFGIHEPGREERVDHQVEVDEAETERHREHQDEDPLDGRVPPVDHRGQLAVEPHEPRERQQHLDDRADQDPDRVDVELPVFGVCLGDADDERENDREIPEHRAQRRDREPLVAVQDPHGDPRHAEQGDAREQHAGEADEEILLLALVAERTHDPRGEHDEEGGQSRETERQEEQEARGNAPRPGSLSFLEQLAEHRHERRAERQVCDESPHEVRNLERDGEGVDPALGAERPGRNDLTEETGDARDAGQDREDGGRPGEPATVAGPAERLVDDRGVRHVRRV